MMGVRIDPLTMAETVAATEKFVRDKTTPFDGGQRR